MKKHKRLLYVRSGPYELSFSSYNLQEVGLAAAFCRLGYDCDIWYYAKINHEQEIPMAGRKIRILWRKGFKLCRSGIYPELYRKKFLAQYDFIIASEYSQITSVILSRKARNVYVYNGPYYNLFKIPFLERPYDALFCSYLNKKVQKVFCKTKMSSEYLEKKGITNSEIVGVGLDISKFESETAIQDDTRWVVNHMRGKRNMLYIGSLSKRKNFSFLIKVFKRIAETCQDEKLQLVVIGDGSEKYVSSSMSILTEEEKKRVIRCKFIANAQLKYIYPEAEVFLLPSIREIFGMVLLEAMYFGLPVVSGNSAGADTVIKDGENGYIVSDFQLDTWTSKVANLFNDPALASEMGSHAKATILTDYLWDGIVAKMRPYLENQSAGEWKD